MNLNLYRAHLLGAAGVLVLVGILAVSPALAQASDEDGNLHEQWRGAIQSTETPGLGCFHASYPDTNWVAVPCVHRTHWKPRLTFTQRLKMRQIRADGTHNTGNGNDWVLSSTSLIGASTGEFSAETGVTSETNPGSGGNNAFSLQLNTNTFKSAACSGSSCMGWQQFFYATGPYVIQMQAWLLGYNGKCSKLGSAWESDGSGDCYYTTDGTTVPQLLPEDLTKIKIQTTAVKGGKDTVVYTTSSEAYSNSQPDTIVYASAGWTQTEFNVFGNYNSTTADFNKGSSITVKIFDGKSATPTCVNNGSTGEQNNLTLSTCSAGPGYIKFSESN